MSRAEVSQATGMVVAQLKIGPAEALVRLRAHAYATGLGDRRGPRHPRASTSTRRRLMTETPCETRVLDAVVTLVDSLLHDFDVVELLTDLTEHCAQLLESPPRACSSPIRGGSCI